MYDDLGVVLIIVVIFLGGLVCGILLGKNVHISERPISQFEIRLLKMNVTIIDADIDFKDIIEVDAATFLAKLTHYNCTQIYRRQIVVFLFGQSLIRYYFVPENERFAFKTNGKLEGS